MTSVPAPTCPCGAPSEWMGGFGRACQPCLPVSAVAHLAWARLAKEINRRFAEAIGRLS